MLIIREVMNCKPGKVKPLVEKFLAMSKLMDKSGMKMRVMTDVSAERYWTAVAEMEVPKTCTDETSAAFLQQLRVQHTEPLIVIWDNGPAHRGDALRAYLATPDLRLRLVRLPADSPDFNADEALWGWVREEVTANTCFGTQAKVRAAVGPFFRGLTDRADEVRRRCRTVLQTQADALTPVAAAILHHPAHVGPTVALV